jgi:hypothetical protein
VASEDRGRLGGEDAAICWQLMRVCNRHGSHLRRWPCNILRLGILMKLQEAGATVVSRTRVVRRRGYVEVAGRAVCGLGISGVSRRGDMPRAATMIRASRRAKAEASAKPIVGAAENATFGTRSSGRYTSLGGHRNCCVGIYGTSWVVYERRHVDIGASRLMERAGLPF